jgi:hypothetical protein
LSTRVPISFCLGVSDWGSSLNHSSEPLTDMSAASPICLPAIFTHNDSGLSRAPLQASQGMSVK